MARRRAQLAVEAVEHGLEVQQLAAGHVRVDRGVLERDADAAPHRARVGHQVVAGHRRAAPRSG